MARHAVDLKVPQQIWIENTDIDVRVWSDEQLLGQVHISKGSIDWRPTRARQRYQLTWEAFDRLMTEHGRRARPT
jgi:hypothetical protein